MKFIWKENRGLIAVGNIRNFLFTATGTLFAITDYGPGIERIARFNGNHDKEKLLRAVQHASNLDGDVIDLGRNSPVYEVIKRRT
jgi:hypothetical protein